MNQLMTVQLARFARNVFFLNESPTAVVYSWRADVKQHHSYFGRQFMGEERLRSDKLFFWLSPGRASDCTKILHCSPLSRRLSIFGHIACMDDDTDAKVILTAPASEN